MKFYPNIIALFLIPFLIGLMFAEPSFAAEKKDKAARKAALMMQQIKQDMDAMQAQFATEKQALEAQIKNGNRSQNAS
jgi:uncharacterized protein YlxW (UPF0749 family)